MPRCDNALAYRLAQRGFELRNPAKSIRIHHHHASAVRTFAAANKFAPPPWLHLEATDLHERGRTRVLRKWFSPKWQYYRLRLWWGRIRSRSTGA
jgi:hypothetical protein